MCCNIPNLSLGDQILARFNNELNASDSIDNGEAVNREQQPPPMHIAGNRARPSPSADSRIEQNDSRADSVDISAALETCQQQRMLRKLRACECPGLEESTIPIETGIPRLGDAINSHKRTAFLTSTSDSITFFRDYRKFQSILMRVVLEGR